MHNQYLIFSGHHHYPGANWFHRVWYNNLFRSAQPDMVAIIGQPGLIDPIHRKGVWIVPQGDLGGCGQLLRREKSSFMAEVSAMWMMGLWYAYISERDAIYVEQDVLCFGHWIERLYERVQGKQCVFGRAATHGISTSLFLIKHEFIPFFCADYVREGPEDHANRIPEMKVLRMANRNPEWYAFNDMPFDTDRPLRYDEPVWYAQKFTDEEMIDLEQKQMISSMDAEDRPEDVKLFSNRGPVDP